MSKTKLAKYYDSGCLVIFFFLSLVWGINYIIKVRVWCGGTGVATLLLVQSPLQKRSRSPETLVYTNPLFFAPRRTNCGLWSSGPPQYPIMVNSCGQYPWQCMETCTIINSCTHSFLAGRFLMGMVSALYWVPSQPYAFVPQVLHAQSGNSWD